MRAQQFPKRQERKIQDDKLQPNQEVESFLHSFAVTVLRSHSNAGQDPQDYELRNISRCILSKLNQISCDELLRDLILQRMADYVTKHPRSLQAVGVNVSKVADYVSSQKNRPYQIDFTSTSSLLRMSQLNSSSITCVRNKNKQQPPPKEGSYTVSTQLISKQCPQIIEQSLLDSITFLNVISPPSANEFTFLAQKNSQHSLPFEMTFKRIFSSLYPSSTIQSSLIFNQLIQPKKEEMNFKPFLLSVYDQQIFLNSYDELFFVEKREASDFSLEEVVQAYNEKSLILSEAEILSVAVDIFDALRFLHYNGYFACSFAPNDIVQHNSRWKFKSLDFISLLPHKDRKNLVIPSGYYELTPRDFKAAFLRSEVSIQCSNGEFVDFYCLGAVLNGICDRRYKYSDIISSLIKVLSESQNYQFERIEHILAPIRVSFSKQRGFSLSKGKKNFDASALSYAFTAIGSKSLALTYLKQQGNSVAQLIDRAHVLQLFKDFPNALTTYSIAESTALKSTRKEDLKQLVQIYNSIGNILVKVMKQDIKALEYFKKATELAEKTCTKQSEEYAKSLENQGTALFSLGKLIESETCFSQVLALKLSTEENNYDKKDIAITYQNLALAQESLAKFLPAVGNFKKAAETVEKCFGKADSDLPLLYQSIARVFDRLPGKQQDALDFRERANQLLMRQ